MISSFDYYKQIENPDMYLGNPDQKLIGALNGQNRHIILRFNDLSELTFSVPKVSNRESDYDMVATKRLVFVDKIGWFKISSVVEETEGDIIEKKVTAESHQAIFKDRGFASEERVYMFYNPNDPLDERYDATNLRAMPSVVGQLYQQLGIKVALNNTEIKPTEDRVDWTIIYIDPSLKFSAASFNAMYESAEGATNVCRAFEANEDLYGYDFIINHAERAFKVVFEFDFLYHTITVKRLQDITIPTDIYLSFDNLINSVSVTENAENIVTVMNCAGNDLDIRTVNPMGTNYIVNFDFYKKRKSDDGKIDYPWMSEELISALEDWRLEFNKWQTHDDARTGHERSYSELTLRLQELYESKLKSDEKITNANLQLQSLFSARDQYLSNDSRTIVEGTEWMGSAPIVVERMELGETTLASNIYSVSNYESTETDSKSVFNLCIDDYVGNINFNNFVNKVFDSPCRCMITFTPSVDINHLRIKHNGESRDLIIANFDVSIPAGTKITLLANIEGTDPSIAGGLRLSNIQLKSTFSVDFAITGYKNQPNIVENNGKFTYDFSGIESKTALPNELIAGYMQDLEDDQIEALPDVYLYFSDTQNNTTSNYSYCKLLVSSEVGVAKDSEGVIVRFNQEAGETWSVKAGTITLMGVSFDITRQVPTGYLTISSGSFSQTFISNVYFVYNGMRYHVSIGADGVVTLYCFYVSGFERYTTYVELVGNNGWCSKWENYINTQLAPQNDSYTSQITDIENEMKYINEQCNVQKYIKNRGQNLYNELLNYWIEGTYTNENLAVLENTTIAEMIDLAKELMETAENDLVRSAQPQFQLSVSAVNFIKLLEYKEFTNQLELGRTICVEKTEDILYAPALLSLEYDLDDAETFTLTFSNAAKVDETMMTYAELLQETSSVSRTVASNWLDLTAYSKNKENLKKLTESPLDRTLRAAQKNMAAQAFIVDETGILGRKYDDDSHTSFLPEQIRIINNTILFTQDNWETAALALGKIQYGDGQEAYGLVADVLVGNLMLSSQMVITNGDDDNSILLNDTGILIKHEGENVFVADTSGNLELTGIIHATGGDFTGVVHAESGEFNGAITATSLTLDIDAKIGGSISSLNYEEDGTDVTGMKINFGNNPYIRSPYFLLDNNGKVTAKGANIEGNIDATSGRIGGFTFNEDNGLVSDSLSIKPTLIFFQTQSMLNLANFAYLQDTDSATEIYTSGAKDFKIRNADGGGFLFKANQEDQTITKNIYVSDLKKTIEYGYGESWSYANFTISVGTSSTEVLSDDISITISFKYQELYWFSLRDKYLSETFTLPAGTHSKSFVFQLTSCTEGSAVSWKITSHSQGHTSYTTDNLTITQTFASGTNNVVYSLGSIMPSAPNTLFLGDTNNPWKSLVVESFTQTGSDIKIKKDVSAINERYELMFDKLIPQTFRYIDGDSGRYHIGFIAQDVERAISDSGLTNIDFAGLCISNPSDTVNSSYTLRYEEFIALNTWVIQKLKFRVSELEKQLKELKGE